MSRHITPVANTPIARATTTTIPFTTVGTGSDIFNTVVFVYPGDQLDITGVTLARDLRIVVERAAPLTSDDQTINYSITIGGVVVAANISSLPSRQTHALDATHDYITKYTTSITNDINSKLAILVYFEEVNHPIYSD